MKNNTKYKIFKRFNLKVSVSAKVSAICGNGSFGIGEYLRIGIGGNFGIGAALVRWVISERSEYGGNFYFE